MTGRCCCSAARGAELVPVPLEADGLDVDAFEAALAGGPVKLAHVIPNFHNPAGCTLSAAKRERLVELAAEHGFWLFEDDPYRLISFGDEEPPPTMLAHDGAGRVIHASSFSKTVSPGVRVGYLAGPAERSRRSPSVAPSTTSRRTCSPSRSCSSSAAPGALADNIEFVNGALAERRDALVEALREQLPEAEFVVPGGGYFLWLDLAGGLRHAGAAGRGQGRGRRFVAGPDFMLEGGGSSLRLSFASVPAERIAEGVARLARALESARAPPAPPEPPPPGGWAPAALPPFLTNSVKKMLG